MPYELSCPSCGVVVASPFVRVGAVVICARCGHKYRIADSHVKRKVAAAVGQGPAAAGEHLVADENEPSTEELVRRAADGHVIGLSGLTEMMRHEPAPPGARSAPPPAGRAVHTAAQAARKSARHQARRRDSRVVYAMFAGLGLVMACIGVALWLAVTSDGWVINTTQPPRPSNPPAHAAPAAYADLPLQLAQPMRIKPWQPVDGAYAPQPENSEAWLVDQARVFTGAAEEHFTASIVTTSSDIITAGTLHIVLVDADGDAVVRTQMPVALFSDDRRQRIRIPLPAGLPDGLLHVDAWVDIQERIPGGIYLPDPQITPLADQGDHTILVTVVNPADHAIERLVLLITAADDRDRPLAQWRCEITQLIKPGDQTKLRLTLPNHTEAPDHWTVQAAGS